ncbi:MAG: O-antigen ligase family protein [Caldilinea sp.]
MRDQLQVLAELKKPASLLYLGLATLLIAYYVHTVGMLDTSWTLRLFVLFSLVLLWGVPVSPLFGLASYLLLAHGLPRYGAMHDFLLAQHAFEWICLLLGLGIGLWMHRTRVRLEITHPPTLLLLLLMAWIGVSLLGVWLSDSAWAPPLRHHPLLFFQGLVLYWVASQYLRQPLRSFLLALGISLLPVLRWFMQPLQELHLEGDTAQLCAIALAISVVGVWHARILVMRFLFAAAGINALFMLLITQNRAAAITAFAALLVLWLTGKRKLLILTLGLLATLALIQFAVPDDYWNRFEAIWAPEASHATAGLDRSTVQERLALWTASIEIIKDHPWLGVGPGNFPTVVGFYKLSLANLTVHNSYLAMAAEAGIPALLLFVALTCSVLLSLARTWRLSSGETAALSRLLMACLVGFLAGAVFISRHDSPLLYLMMGWAVAVAHSARLTRRDQTNRAQG